LESIIRILTDLSSVQQTRSPPHARAAAATAAAAADDDDKGIATAPSGTRSGNTEW